MTIEFTTNEVTDLMMAVYTVMNEKSAAEKWEKLHFKLRKAMRDERIRLDETSEE